jgi:hypothetical protein
MVEDAFFQYRTREMALQHSFTYRIYILFLLDEKISQEERFVSYIKRMFDRGTNISEEYLTHREIQTQYIALYKESDLTNAMDIVANLESQPTLLFHKCTNMIDKIYLFGGGVSNVGIQTDTWMTKHNTRS